jgi:hypothetical protein
MRLRIDQIAVEISRDQHAQDAAETVRKALALLANRLAEAPLHDAAPERALALIELGPVAPDYLAGPGAAARIADDLYRQIARRRA